MVNFTKEQITSKISRIRGVGDVCTYFIEGNQRAALIDTGYGVGDLKGFLDRLTDKPYDVILTHGHVDHASGAGQFEQVYMNPIDLETFNRHCDVEYRKKSLRLCCPETLESLSEEDFIPKKEDKLPSLEDGQLFDLGGVTLETIQVPGHTKGIMVILIREERIAMFGDACGVGALLSLPESTSIQEYHKSLLKLKQFEAQYDRVLREHGTCQSTKHVLEDCIEACEKIMDGTDDAVPIDFMGETVYRAFKTDPETGNRLDGREGNIIYSKSKIR